MQDTARPNQVHPLIIQFEPIMKLMTPSSKEKDYNDFTEVSTHDLGINQLKDNEAFARAYTGVSNKKSKELPKHLLISNLR